jgi:hypothetical protein
MQVAGLLTGTVSIIILPPDGRSSGSNNFQMTA